ncbi:MAG: alternative ribosome rescue aminoacyl-tRNA hydrolase ArfB [Vicinamibacterales bacterium]
MLHITDQLAIAERELEERFVRASGPGGQNVNEGVDGGRVALRRRAFVAAGRHQGATVRLAGSRMTTDGVLVIDSREHRTQAMNREAARARLVTLVQQAAVRPRARRATRPGKAAKERRISEKKRRADVKSGRRRSPRGDD